MIYIRPSGERDLTDKWWFARESHSPIITLGEECTRRSQKSEDFVCGETRPESSLGGRYLAGSVPVACR